MAFFTSQHLGLCQIEDYHRLQAHYKKIKLPLHPAEFGLKDITAEKMLCHMRQDKKVVGSQLTLVLAHGIGQAFLTRDVKETDLINALSSYLEQP